MPIAYCVKCKKKTDQVDAKLITNGKRARMGGKCQVCKTSTSVFVKAEKGGGESEEEA